MINLLTSISRTRLARSATVKNLVKMMKKVLMIIMMMRISVGVILERRWKKLNESS